MKLDEGLRFVEQTGTFRVFYSWQADLPNSTNRSFIEGCLGKAVRRLPKSSGFSTDLSCSIVRDTAGCRGAPEISSSILSQISTSDLAVFDVSIINGDLVASSSARPVCNPNVLLELGYAVGKLGWERVVLVMNEEFGQIESLPFDLRGRRTVGYRLSPGDNKAEARSRLVPVLLKALSSMVSMGRRVSHEEKRHRAIAARLEAGFNPLKVVLAMLGHSAKPEVDWRSMLDQILGKPPEVGSRVTLEQSLNFYQDRIYEAPLFAQVTERLDQLPSGYGALMAVNAVGEQATSLRVGDILVGALHHIISAISEAKQLFGAAADPDDLETLRRLGEIASSAMMFLAPCQKLGSSGIDDEGRVINAEAKYFLGRLLHSTPAVYRMLSPHRASLEEEAKLLSDETLVKLGPGSNTEIKF